jgi:hypothetical protein
MKKIRPLSPRTKTWLLTVLASAIVVGFSYLAVQQNYRLGANDSLVQNAELLESYLSAGAQPDQLANGAVDPTKSLSMFFAITDDNQKPIGGSLQVNGTTPLPPKGVFETAQKKGVDEITWQPAKGVRTAIVVKHFKGTKQSGYVVVGSSLREVESHENQLTLMALIAFLALVAVDTLAVVSLVPRQPKAVTKVVAKAESTPLRELEAEAAPAKQAKKTAAKAKTTKKKTTRKASK